MHRSVVQQSECPAQSDPAFLGVHSNTRSYSPTGPLIASGTDPSKPHSDSALRAKPVFPCGALGRLNRTIHRASSLGTLRGPVVGTGTLSEIIRVFQNFGTFTSLRPISLHFAKYAYLNKRFVFRGKYSSEIIQSYRLAWSCRSRGHCGRARGRI